VRQYATFPTRSRIPTINPRTQVNLPVKAAAGKSGILAELREYLLSRALSAFFYFLSGSAFFQGSEQLAL
jgi:hypothetical protein